MCSIFGPLGSTIGLAHTDDRGDTATTSVSEESVERKRQFFTDWRRHLREQILPDFVLHPELPTLLRDMHSLGLQAMWLVGSATLLRDIESKDYDIKALITAPSRRLPWGFKRVGKFFAYKQYLQQHPSIYSKPLDCAVYYRADWLKSRLRFAEIAIRIDIATIQSQLQLKEFSLFERASLRIDCDPIQSLAFNLFKSVDIAASAKNMLQEEEIIDMVHQAHVSIQPYLAQFSQGFAKWFWRYVLKVQEIAKSVILKGQELRAAQCAIVPQLQKAGEVELCLKFQEVVPPHQQKEVLQCALQLGLSEGPCQILEAYIQSNKVFPRNVQGTVLSLCIEQWRRYQKLQQREAAKFQHIAIARQQSWVRYIITRHQQIDKEGIRQLYKIHQRAQNICIHLQQQQVDRQQFREKEWCKRCALSKGQVKVYRALMVQRGISAHAIHSKALQYYVAGEQQVFKLQHLLIQTLLEREQLYHRERQGTFQFQQRGQQQLKQIKSGEKRERLVIYQEEKSLRKRVFPLYTRVLEQQQSLWKGAIQARHALFLGALENSIKDFLYTQAKSIRVFFTDMLMLAVKKMEWWKLSERALVVLDTLSQTPSGCPISTLRFLHALFIQGKPFDKIKTPDVLKHYEEKVQHKLLLRQIHQFMGMIKQGFLWYQVSMAAICAGTDVWENFLKLLGNLGVSRRLLQKMQKGYPAIGAGLEDLIQERAWLEGGGWMKLLECFQKEQCCVHPNIQFICCNRWQSEEEDIENWLQVLYIQRQYASASQREVFDSLRAFLLYPLQMDEKPLQFPRIHTQGQFEALENLWNLMEVQIALTAAWEKQFRREALQINKLFCHVPLSIRGGVIDWWQENIQQAQKQLSTVSALEAVFERYTLQCIRLQKEIPSLTNFEFKEQALVKLLIEQQIPMKTLKKYESKWEARLSVDTLARLRVVTKIFCDNYKLACTFIKEIKTAFEAKVPMPAIAARMVELILGGSRNVSQLRNILQTIEEQLRSTEELSTIGKVKRTSVSHTIDLVQVLTAHGILPKPLPEQREISFQFTTDGTFRRVK